MQWAQINSCIVDMPTAVADTALRTKNSESVEGGLSTHTLFFFFIISYPDTESNLSIICVFVGSIAAQSTNFAVTAFKVSKLYIH